MREIIRLLELKNEYLEKYLTITKVFIIELEAGELGDPELLKSNRQDILGILQHIDSKISELSDLSESEPEYSNTTKKAINAIVNTRERLAKEIIEVDSVLFTLLDEKKNSIVSDLSKLRDFQEAVAMYENENANISGAFINIEK